MSQELIHENGLVIVRLQYFRELRFPAARLEPPEKHEDQQHDDNRSQSATGVVAPVSAVGPRRDRSEQHQHQEHN